MARHLALLAAVLTALGLAWLAARPPQPRPADAPPAVFSAERAMSDVRIIARAPHPVGSPENARVRDHLVARMTSLGLSPEVRAGETDGTRIENILGRLPGRDPAVPALLLMAHYDSVPGSPGAADDAAGVAAILETLRAFQAAGGRPAQDVLVLLTDGEERGLYGARAFFRSEPERTRIGVVLNFEARGAAGRTYMFETGPENGALVERFARAVASPSANSLMRFVYDRMPNGTDFTVPKERFGLPGLNFAFIGDQAAYHTPLATPDRLDQGSLQHMGDQALGVLSALAAEPTAALKADDLVYADLFGLTLVRYAKAFGWLLLLAAAGAIAAAAWRARREPGLPAGAAEGAGRLVLGVLLSGALLFGVRQVLPGYGDADLDDLLARAPLVLAGMGALLALGVGVAQLRLRRGPAAHVGALGVGLALACALQAAAPETAFVATWPVLWGALTALAVAYGGRAARVIAVLAGAIGLAWIAGLVHMLFLGVGLLFPEALSVGALLAPLVLHPLLVRPPRASPASSRTIPAGPGPA